MAFVELAAPHLKDRSASQWLARLDDEHLNLRAAFVYVLGTPGGANLVLDRFWDLRRWWLEARQPAQSLGLLEQALALVDTDTEPIRRARALYCQAVLLVSLDRRLELGTISDALDLARKAGDKGLVAEVLSRYSRSQSDNGSDRIALEAGAEAVAEARQINDPVLLGSVLFQYASVLDQAFDADAESIYLEALDLVEHSGDIQTEWLLHNNYALVLIDQGNLADARHHLEAALDLLGNGRVRTTTLYNLSWIYLQEGDPQRSASHQSEVLRAARLDGFTWMLPYSVLGLACSAAQLGFPEHAAVLHGGAAALLSASSDQWDILEGKIRERELSALGERLGDGLEHLYMQGLAMPHDEIVKLALSGP